MTLLDVQDLSIVYEPRGAEPVTAVRGATFTLEQGEFIGLVGESGSGKSTLGFALTGLAKAPARITSGRITFDGTDIAHLGGEDLRRQRRGGFAMVLQSGMNALNPVRTIGNHFADIFAAHEHVPRGRRRERAVELVEKVKLPASVLDRYPGELSGGMRQRVAIALAMSLDPRLLVFDEPTTALDVLVQRAVMETIIELQREENFTAILVSHDLGVVLESTARVLVMHEGVIVEDGPSARILRDPQDDYTKMLLSHYADPRAEVVELPGLRVAGSQISTTGEPPAAIGTDAAPSGGAKARTGRTREAVVLEGVGKVYPPPRRGEDPVVAVDDVSFTIEPGDALALVGASGSGKSTIAKLITGVERPTSGTVRLGETDVGSLRRGGLRRLRRDVQMVFQDPYSALNPLHSVEYTLMRPVVNFGGLRGLEARRRVLELLDIVGLAPVEQFAAKLPHQLSGGQRQRVVIARALACDPQVIIADEPVSMLDVSLRAGVLALIEGLREQWGVSLLFITHDLLSARLVTDKILVLNRGRVVERGETAQVLRFPEDAYTVELLDAVPQPGRAAD
ncbi:ABC transporter ATP-binding protein [Occultella kanbiaonis]|uniref:ABC transporter ATP-binding protein n=1 Tax=Occultella kanbiaonis TaxID=2675754 RepID=UPI0012B77524|nr:ABC transporter ATP-binding protein [Occultella kanbiaonis]